MKIDRAMEILDPEHREQYSGLEEVNEACRMGMEALRIVLEVKDKAPALLAVSLREAEDMMRRGICTAGQRSLVSKAADMLQKIGELCWGLDTAKNEESADTIIEVQPGGKVVDLNAKETPMCSGDSCPIDWPED